MSNSLYILQTHCVKYRIKTFWCQLDKRSYNQALLYFIIWCTCNCVFNNYRYQCWQVKSNPAAPLKKKQCTRKKGEDESEKAATTSTGTHSALTLPEAENCEPVYLPPLDYLTVNLQCLVLLTVDKSYCSQQLVALVPCHIWVEADCVGDGLHLYSFSTWNSHAIITI